jgi:flavin-dependent dehydrogenase
MKRYSRAIVLGGSISGLLTARVLADHFERVIIVERDTLPREPEQRNGAPQGHHLHNLLVSGLHIMEGFFPGFEADLVAAGAKRMNWIKDVASFTAGSWLPRVETSLNGRVASRPLIEWAIRKRMFSRFDVSFLEQTEVMGLVTDVFKTTVTGVRLRSRNGENQEYELLADLVVDATGRASKASAWLESLGYGKPEETVVDAKVGYASRLYRKPEHSGIDWSVLYMPAYAPQTRGGGIFEQEDNTWLVTLGGFSADYPSTDPDEFLAYAKTLPAPELYLAIKDAEPLSGVMSYRRTHNRVYHYERMKRFPSRFLLIGDAVCAFNPIYGQGMTVAAMGAQLLEKVFAQRPTLDGVGQQFHRQLAKQNENVWLLTTGIDLQHAATEGKRPNAAARFVQRYLDQYVAVMFNDFYLLEEFFKVQNLMVPATALLKPAALLRVLVGLMRDKGKLTLPQQDAHATELHPITD